MSNDIEIVVRTDDSKATFDKPTMGAETLKRKLAETERQAKALREEFHRTGNVDLLPKMDKAEADLKKLHARVKDFTKDIKDDFRKGGEESGDSLSRGFSGRVFAALSTAGAKAGVTFGSNLTAAAGPMIGVGVVAGLQAAVAAAPAAGGLAGFGLVAGIAAKISAGKPAVKAAFGGMTEEIKQDLESVSGPMDRVLINLARDLRDLSSENVGKIGELFGQAATQAGQLTSTIRPLVQNLMPGIADALDGVQPTIDVLQQEIPEMGTAISGFLSDLAEGGEMGARTVQMLMDALQNSLGILGETIKLGNQWMEMFPPGILLLSELGDKHKSAADAATQHAAGTEELATAEELAAEAAKTEADALQGVIDKMTRLGRLTLSSRDAERDYQEAVDSASESIRKNGRTLDIGTAAGRKNQAALDAIARATQNKIAADGRAGASTRSLAATQERGRQAFINAATAMGMEIGQARALAASLFAIPNVVRTVTIRERYIQDARARGGRPGGGEQKDAHGGVVGHFPGAASGGMRAGMTWVGEEGPELMQLPPGTHVYPAGTSRNMAGGGGGVADVLLRFAPSAESALMRAIIEALRYEVRVQGRGSAERFFARTA